MREVQGQTRLESGLVPPLTTFSDIMDIASTTRLCMLLEVAPTTRLVAVAGRPLAVAGRCMATRLRQLLEVAWRPDFGSCWKLLGDQTLAVAGSLLRRLDFGSCWKTLGNQTFGSCWKLLQWSYNQTSVVPLSPSATKNSPYPARLKNPPTPQMHQLHRTKRPRTERGCNSLDKKKLQQLKGMCDSARREREPLKALNGATTRLFLAVAGICCNALFLTCIV